MTSGNDHSPPVYLDHTKPLDERVEDLLGRMTLEEKVSQLVDDSAEIERLGVGEYHWWNEALHGVARAGRATVFPQAIGMAATFDVALIKRVGAAISDEARAKYNAALAAGRHKQYWGLTFWSPNVNIFRDPRWGRGHETWGEDPVLTGEMAAGFVAGLQGDHPKYLKTAACAKHFAVHSGPEADRHHFDAVASPKDMYETYLPAFKRLVDEGVEAVMSAYNRTNGEPCSASKTLLIDILREKWGFEGHVVSDCGAIEDIHKHHKLTANGIESAALAIKNGCDLNCGGCFLNAFAAAAQGLLSEADVNRAVGRLLRTRFKLGMFDPEEVNPYSTTSLDVVDSPPHRELARRAAARSMVLLKNAGNVLPISKDVGDIFVVGPNAASLDVLLGNYHGVSSRMVTPLEGITERVGPVTTVKYTAGCLFDRVSPNPNVSAAGQPVKGDVVVAVMGINALFENEEGDAILAPAGGDREDIRLPQNQIEYIKMLAEGSGKLVVVIGAGSALALGEVADLADAIIYMWYPGEEGGTALADVLFGDECPSGRLPVTFVKGLEQLPPYEDYSLRGRTYRYMADEPLYPFGFGLSYTRFEYGEIALGASSVKAGDTLTAEVTVTNAGQREAEEVVQLYISDLDASTYTPLYALKDFKRVAISPGRSATVTFEITPEMMALVCDDGESRIEPGDFKVTIGGACPHPLSVKLGAPEPAAAVFAVV